jgi:endoglucanase
MVAAVAALMVLAVATPVTTARAASPVRGYLRVDQVGYQPGTVSVLLMTRATVQAERVTVTDAAGRTVAHAVTGKRTGWWSPTFPAVYRVDLPTLTAPGTYTVHVSGPAWATPATVRVGSGAALFTGPLDATVSFLTMQRDGPNVVPGDLDRQPSHLTDEHATVYAPPTYDSDDVLVGDLSRVGGPVDASGGWFDAGDYEKFVQTASYTDALLFLASRSRPDDAALAAEARYGVQWLGRMWDDRTATLYYQVGMGDADWPRIVGDHDVWRLPQADDQLDVQPGDPSYYLKYRPVFRAGPPGSKVSPNLAGRTAASFALAAQALAPTDRAAASRWLGEARHLLGLADTHPGELLTVSPHDYYPEDSWRDDLQLGWTELVRADEALHVPSVGTDLATAAHWADARLRSAESRDTLNLYDVSALADAELAPLLGARTDLAVTASRLRADALQQLTSAGPVAATEPFGLGHSYQDGDPSPHAFGLAATGQLVGATGPTGGAATLARHQLDWALGANAWGTTFVIGVGQVFPDCPQDQIANLSGTLDGTPPVHAGGVTDGPAVRGTFSGLGIPDGARSCRISGFDHFDGHGVRYMDDVRAWPSVEPADDYTATALLAFALLSAS